MLQAREPDWFEHRMFKGPDTDINLHVFTIGAAEIDRMLLFCSTVVRSDLCHSVRSSRMPAGRHEPGRTAYLHGR